MSVAAIKGEPLSLIGDPRWELVQRIVTSPCFAKSERLSSFLLFVCELSLLGQGHQINEQKIGSTVFERNAHYDTAVDGIVRTHATRLRQRLKQYFGEDGRNETLLVKIPPGSYVPVFVARTWHAPGDAFQQSFGTATMDATVREAQQEGAAEPVSARELPQSKIAPVRNLAFTGALLWMALSIAYLVTHPRLATAIREEWRGAEHPLWSQIFNKRINTVVVSGDMALVNFEIQTGHSVLLGEYARNNYVKQYMDQFALESFSPSSGLFLTNAITVVDSQFIESLFRSSEINLDRTTFRTARDIQLANLRNGNIVLLGDFRFNPWVQAFEPRMNFYFVDSSSELTNSVLMNRSPRNNEQASYHSSDVDHVHTEYSVVAFLPNLSGSGSSLLLEGQSQISTEAAEEFVEDDADLIPFLNKIHRKNGSIPHFEVLLKVKGMSGTVASFEVLTYRVEDY